MSGQPVDQARQTEPKEAPAGGKSPNSAAKALLPGVPLCASGQPEGNPGHVDVTGIVSEGIRIDPNLTEGHPGYEESGDSGLMPAKPMTGGALPADRRGCRCGG
jgi:hypothetical protein